MRIWTLLVSSSLLAISTAAYAQSAPGQAGSPKPAPNTAADSGNIAEIVVTANRREERLQEVPVTVTVVGGEQLTRQNINTVEDLQRSASALNSAGPSGFGAMSIRGIGNLSFSRSSEGSVGVVVDGVALANTSVTPPLLFDIARVEVLEGPQGMLFGRNSSAGVVNIITNAPNPTKFEGIAHADIGERENRIVRGAVNIPLSDNSALRVTGSYAQDPKLQRNLFDGSYNQREAKAGRARFLWEPTDNLTVNLAADYTETDVHGGVSWAVFSSSPTSFLTARLAACGVKVGPENEEGCVDPSAYDSKTAYGTSGQVDFRLGAVTLTSITAYRGTKGKSDGDVDSTTANRLRQWTRDEADNFSQELRVSSATGGVIDYVAGLYYFNSKTDGAVGNLGQLLADLPVIGACPLSPTFLCGLPVGGYRPLETETTSYAVFGQATINVSDRLRFIVGGRYGREEVTADAKQSILSPGAVFEFAPAVAFRRDINDNYLSYRLGGQYDVTKDLMVFATYTKGYKGPAVNDGAIDASVPLIVRPEIPKSGEVGFKATLANGRVALNTTAFYTKVTDFQSQFFDSSITAFVFGNAPELTSKGFSVNFFGRPLAGLTTNLGLTYTDAKYGAGYFAANYLNVPIDAQGNQLGTKWKGTASAEYSTAVANGLEGFVQADLVYHSKAFSNAANDPILAIKGGTIVGGRIGVRTEDSRYGVSVFARNIFDTFRSSARFATPTAIQQLDPASFSQFSSPEAHRLIGLSLDAQF